MRLGPALAVVIVFLGSRGLNGQETATVKDIGDFSRMTIDGLHSFSAEQVRKKLKSDADALLAAHPLAPLAPLPKAVSERLVGGFQRAGFAEATVRTVVNHELGRLEATVHEGPRYTNGNLTIRGTRNIDPAQLRQRLTQKYAAEAAVTPVFRRIGDNRVAVWRDKDGKDLDWEEPVWNRGEPAETDAASKDRFERHVKRALSDLGYRNTEFDTRLEVNRQRREVDLVVEIRSESVPSKIEKIEISGNQISSTDAIIQYLDLPSGTAVTRKLEAQVAYQLWRSGRFISHEVTLAEPLPGDDGQRLKLNVVESPYSPPIDQPISKEAEVFLKMRQWLTDVDAWHGELSLKIRSTSGDADLLLAPGRGVGITIGSGANAPAGQTTLLASGEEIALYPADSEVYFRTEPIEGQCSLQLSLRLDDKPKDAAKPFRVNFFAGVSSDRDDENMPVKIQLLLDPVVAIAIPSIQNATAAWDGDILTLASNKDTYRIDGTDGRLIQFCRTDDDHSETIEFVRGGFDQLLEQSRTASADRENAFDAQRPLSSFFAFCISKDVVSQWAPVLAKAFDFELTRRQKDGLGVLSKFLAMGVFEPIDRKLTENDDKDDAEDKFQLPPRSLDAAGGFVQAIALGIAPLAEDFFPRESWAWTVWREAAFTVGGRGQYLSAQLKRIYESDQFGPVGFLTVAMLMEQVDARAARMFASRGRWRMSAADFRKDYAPLLDPECVAGQCLRRACEIIRELDESELQEMLTWLPGDFSPSLETFAQELRREPNRNLDDAMPAAFEAAWETGLVDIINQHLLVIRDGDGLRIGAKQGKPQ